MDGQNNDIAKRPSRVLVAVSQAPPPLRPHQANTAIKPPHLCPNEYTPPELPQKLRIWQQNVHRSKTAHSYVINTANPKDWNIIALQEPGLTASATPGDRNIGKWYTLLISTMRIGRTFAPSS